MLEVTLTMMIDVNKKRIQKIKLLNIGYTCWHLQVNAKNKSSWKTHFQLILIQKIPACIYYNGISNCKYLYFLSGTHFS